MVDSAPRPGATAADGGCRIREVADELVDRVGGQSEVGFEDPRVPSGLAVDRPGQAHHS